MKILRTISLLLALLLLISGCNLIAEGDNVTSVSSEVTGSISSTSENISSSTSEIITTSKPASTEAETEAPETTTVQVTTEPLITAPELTLPETPTKIKFDISSIPDSKVYEAIQNTSASNAFVYDVTNGKLLANKGSGENIVPASVTKLFSALFALYAVPEDFIIAPLNDELSLIHKNSSTAYIKSHHRLTVAQLIKGMMLPSGNDAAYALAGGVARYLSGDQSLKGQAAVDYFMERVNEYAKAIGCTETYLTFPDGCSSTDNYTSSHDLVIVGQECLKNPIISEYAKIVSQKVKYASGHTITWNNSNQLIDPSNKYYSPYVTGLKTGSLSGNYCLYVSAEIDSTTYLIGIFGAKTKTGRYDDAHILLDALLSVDEPIESEPIISDTSSDAVTSTPLETE